MHVLYVLVRSVLRLVRLPARDAHALRVVLGVEEELKAPDGEEHSDVDPSPPRLGACVEDYGVSTGVLLCRIVTYAGGGCIRQ